MFIWELYEALAVCSSALSLNRRQAFGGTYKMDQKSSRPETQSYSGPGTGSSQQKPNSVGDAINRGRDGISDAANEAAKSAGPDLQAIQNDLNSLKDTLSRFMGCRSIRASGNCVREVRQIPFAR
jgi:hypothetical protein